MTPAVHVAAGLRRVSSSDTPSSGVCLRLSSAARTYYVGAHCPAARARCRLSVSHSDASFACIAPRPVYGTSTPRSVYGTSQQPTQQPTRHRALAGRVGRLCSPPQNPSGTRSASPGRHAATPKEVQRALLRSESPGTSHARCWLARDLAGGALHDVGDRLRRRQEVRQPDRVRRRRRAERLVVASRVAAGRRAAH